MGSLSRPPTITYNVYNIDLERQPLLPRSLSEAREPRSSYKTITMSSLFITVIVLSLLVWWTEASMMNAYGAVTQTATQGIFVGNRLASQVDEYLAIPFAQPPIGDLRFAKTGSVKPFLGKAPRNATAPGPICIQPPSSDSQGSQLQSEDCLQLNIYKPSTLGSGRKVPVMVWLYGGSWQEGSINQARINATRLIERSIELDEPIVWVAANYRVGAFGFLGGQAMADAQQSGEAILNAGMWDQREALNWVQTNIESFGGDPTRVILFGESAGAINAGIHLMADNGVGSTGLFHGAILQSGSAASGGRRPASHSVVESTYSFVLKGSGCDHVTSSIEQIRCLKSASTAELTTGNNLAIANSYIGYMPLQDNYFLRQVPSAQWSSNQYMDIPIITGNNLDEGTEFPYPLTVSDDEAFQRAQIFALGPELESIFPEILSTWSSDPAKGGPIRPEFFDVSPEDTFYPPNGTNQYKRQASMAQDVFFESGRRLQLQSARRAGIQAWTYRFAQPSPVGIGYDAKEVAKASMGVQHEAEIPFAFANPPLQGANAANIPEPLRTYASDENLIQVSNAMSAAWIHFAYSLDPNGIDVPRWDPYAFDSDPDGNGMSLYMQANNFTMTFDDQSNDQVQFVIDNKSHFYI